MTLLPRFVRRFMARRWARRLPGSTPAEEQAMVAFINARLAEA